MTAVKTALNEIYEVDCCLYNHGKCFSTVTDRYYGTCWLLAFSCYGLLTLIQAAARVNWKFPPNSDKPRGIFSNGYVNRINAWRFQRTREKETRYDKWKASKRRNDCLRENLCPLIFIHLIVISPIISSSLPKWTIFWISSYLFTKSLLQFHDIKVPQIDTHATPIWSLKFEENYCIHAPPINFRNKMIPRSEVNALCHTR